MTPHLTFDDILLLPKFSRISSRKDVSLDNGFSRLPIISANMDTITSVEMARAMKTAGGLACLHRFWSIEDNVTALVNSAIGGQSPWVAVGLGDHELKRAKALYDHGARMFVLDVAHAANINVVDMYMTLKDGLPDIFLTVGNFATFESVNEFWVQMNQGEKRYDLDGIKIGIGPGCFAANTRILMANGTYKNIQDIKLQDKIINKNGAPVEVVGTKFSGFRKVLKYKNNNFYKDTYSTSDHQHWVGDYSSIKNIQKYSMKSILDKSTKDEKSKYKWKELQHCENSVFLLPKNIQFTLPKTFNVNLQEFGLSKRTFKNGKIVEYSDISPTYDLGYLFGTFLGDGCANITSSPRKIKNSDKISKNTSGKTYWYFGKKENFIADKVKIALKSVFNCEANIIETSNMLKVVNFNNNLSRLFIEFGKKSNKHLPEKYLCDNSEYLKGLYEGLIDSDGYYSKDGRDCFSNTSQILIELFGLVCKLVKGYYPSITIKAPTSGNLPNCNIDNCKESYTARTVVNPEANFTQDYQICRTYTIENTDLIIPTYDIEVDCPTHSFIANNAIVHNSACTTRIKTGVGVPQLSAIIDIASNMKDRVGLVIADGGCRTPGDVAKALAAGAHMVMLGGMLAGTDETPGELITDNMDLCRRSQNDIETLKQICHKVYRGSASKESYEIQGKAGSHLTDEGESFIVLSKGPVAHVLQDIEGGLRSAFSYTGSANLEEFHKNAEFIQITNSGLTESGAHGKK